MLDNIKFFYRNNQYNNLLNPFSYILLVGIDFMFFVKNRINAFLISKHFHDTKKLKNSFKNKSAFVLANGPSLKKINLAAIKKRQEDHGDKVICINSFINKLSSKLIPDFYVVTDPVYFGLDQDNHNEITLKEVQNDLKLIEKYKIPTFIPVKFKDNINIKTKFYYFNDVEQRRFNSNVIDITKPRSYLSMTAYKSLSIACYLGFKEIYIAGFDNDYFKTIEVDKENRVYYSEEHYVNQGSSGKRLFSTSEGLKQNQNTESENLGKLLLSLSYLFSDLDKFPKNIINLNEESLVNSFKKEDIFRNSHY